MKKLILILLIVVFALPGVFTVSASDYTISVSASLGGSVSPDSEVAVPVNETQSFTISPDSGYAIKYVKFNGIVVLSGQSSETIYTTPAITKNSDLEVEFYSASSETTLLTSPLLFKGRKDDIDENIYTYTFGRFTGSASDATDFGVLIQGKKYALKDDELNKAKESGLFGIGICDINNLLDDVYSVTPYITKDNQDILAEETNVNKNMEDTVQEKIITASYGGFKRYSYADWWIKGALPFVGEIAEKKLRLRSNNATIVGSTSYIAVIEFDLSVLPSNYELESATLDLTAVLHSFSSSSPKIIANVGDLNWQTLGANTPVYTVEMELGRASVIGENISVSNTGTCTIALNKSKISGNKLVIELRREYISTEVSGYTEFDTQINLPKLTIQYH